MPQSKLCGTSARPLKRTYHLVNTRRNNRRTNNNLRQYQSPRFAVIGAAVVVSRHSKCSVQISWSHPHGNMRWTNFHSSRSGIRPTSVVKNVCNMICTFARTRMYYWKSHENPTHRTENWLEESAEKAELWAFRERGEGIGCLPRVRAMGIRMVPASEAISETISFGTLVASASESGSGLELVGTRKWGRIESITDGLETGMHRVKLRRALRLDVALRSSVAATIRVASALRDDSPRFECLPSRPRLCLVVRVRT